MALVYLRCTLLKMECAYEIRFFPCDVTLSEMALKISQLRKEDRPEMNDSMHELSWLHHGESMAIETSGSSGCF